MSNVEVSGVELYKAFLHANMTRAQVAAMSMEALTRSVAYGRKKRAPAHLRDLALSDEEIARRILAYARGVAVEGVEAEIGGGETSTETRLLMQLLDQAEEQTKYLRTIRSVMILWGVLLILGLFLGTCAGMGMLGG